MQAVRPVLRRMAWMVVAVSNLHCGTILGLDEFQENGDSAIPRDSAPDASSADASFDTSSADASFDALPDRPDIAVGSPHVVWSDGSQDCRCNACACEVVACRNDVNCKNLLGCVTGLRCFMENCIDVCDKANPGPSGAGPGVGALRDVASCMSDQGCTCLDGQAVENASCPSDDAPVDAPLPCAICEDVPIALAPMAPLHACCLGMTCGHEFPRTATDTNPPCVAVEGDGLLDPGCPDFEATADPPPGFPANVKLDGCCTARSHICGYASTTIGCFNPGWGGSLPCPGPSDEAGDSSGGASGYDAAGE